MPGLMSLYGHYFFPLKNPGKYVPENRISPVPHASKAQRGSPGLWIWIGQPL